MVGIHKRIFLQLEEFVLRKRRVAWDLWGFHKRACIGKDWHCKSSGESKISTCVSQSLLGEGTEGRLGSLRGWLLGKGSVWAGSGCTKHRWAEWTGKSWRCGIGLLCLISPLTTARTHTHSSWLRAPLPTLYIPTCSALSASPGPFHSPRFHPGSSRKCSRWV